MKVEKELKFFFPLQMTGVLEEKLGKFEYICKKYEITALYDNPNPKLSFYDKKIDGRLRLRTMKYLDGQNVGENRALLSWKQRIPEYSGTTVRHENEIECDILSHDIENIRDILEKVLKCPKISSYERNRKHYHANGLDITLDTFPFGLMLEFELKDGASTEDIFSAVKDLELNAKEASLLSCDDMYRELCVKQNKKSKSDILFDDDEMPKL